MNAIGVFCGSRSGEADSYRAAAVLLGAEIAAHGLRLVYGGGRIGLMGVVADAALAGGGQVIGIIPEALAEREAAHAGLTELILTRSMHERKAKMAEFADGVIALPGGYGTLEELCEILTWAQLGIHRKPIGLLDVDDFFDPLIGLFDSMVVRGFLPPVHRSLILRSASASRLLEDFAAYKAPEIPRWVTPFET